MIAAQTQSDQAYTVQESSEGKSIVVLLLADQQRAHQLAARLCSTVAHAVAVPTLDHLHAVASHERVDLIIIEQELRGLFTGAEIMDRLARQLICPGVVLLCENVAAGDVIAQSLPVDRVLSTHSTDDEIATTVNLAIARRSQRHCDIPRVARLIVDEIAELPVLPQLVMKLLPYLSMEPSTIPVGKMAADIAVDPIATARLLKLSNSSHAGLQRKVSNPAQAIALFGPKRCISLLFAATTLPSIKGAMHSLPESLRAWYYRRSILISSTAATFAERLDFVLPDMAFVLGLMQELGTVVLACHSPDRYLPIIKRFREVGVAQLSAMEREAFHTTHGELTAAMLQKWGLDESLIHPVLEHDEPVETGRSKTDAGFLRCMRIGEALANLSDCPHPFRNARLNELFAQYPANKRSQCKAALAESILRSGESSSLLSAPEPNAEELRSVLEDALPDPAAGSITT